MPIVRDREYSWGTTVFLRSLSCDYWVRSDCPEGAHFARLRALMRYAYVALNFRGHSSGTHALKSKLMTSLLGKLQNGSHRIDPF